MSSLMQLHRLDYIWPMAPKPDDSLVAAWIELSRAQRRASATVEARLKEAGLPPLAWYDALWELDRAPESGLRPFELEQAMLFEQSNLSRLAERLVKAGLIERRYCAQDRRGFFLAITPQGRELRKRMWEVYAPAIEEAIGKRLDRPEAEALAGLLSRLG